MASFLAGAERNLKIRKADLLDFFVDQLLLAAAAPGSNLLEGILASLVAEGVGVRALAHEVRGARVFCA